MRLLAIITNLAQIGFILLIFFQMGLKLGGWIIPTFFVLLVTTLLNLVVLLFYSANKAIHHPLFGLGNEVVKRQDVRISYGIGPHPSVTINDRPFRVLDLAENGMRFSIDRQELLQKQLRGRISLLCGQTFPFNGILIRRLGEEASVNFSAPIAQNLLAKESRMLQAVKQ